MIQMIIYGIQIPGMVFPTSKCPTFGILWELLLRVICERSYGRLVKGHMKQVIGCIHTCLTVIEFTILLTQNKVCISSHHITPLSPEPSNLLHLTPAHFLTNLPEATLKSLPFNHLNHWEKM